MPQPTKGKRLGGSAAHQKAILSNLATSLFEHGAITTTEAKARRLRPFAEKLISKAKRGDLHNRRQVMAVIRDKTVVHVLFTEIGPRYAARPGGYTRITKLGPRKGDNAPMAVIALVEEQFTSQARATRTTTPTSRTGPAPASTDGGSTAADVAAVDESQVDEAQVDEAEVDETQVDETVDTPLGDAPVEAAADEATGEEVSDSAVVSEPVVDAAMSEQTPPGDAAVDEPVPAETQVVDDVQVQGQEAVAAQESQGEVPAAPADDTGATEQK